MLLANPSIENLIASLIAVLLGMTIHEFAHCYVADLMGDPTPRSLGRLTLNPVVHIHWVGFLMFVLIGFGILGSAPITPWRMRNPRWGTLAAVAAGPLSNLLVAILFALIARLLPGSVLSVGLVGQVLGVTIYFNILMFLFNLIPVYPLDGWRIVLSLLPADLANWWQQHQVTSQYIFFGLIMLSFIRIGNFDPLRLLIFQPTNSIFNFLVR